jgi:AAA+ ATPase superfamily predicted ATPase
MHTPFIYGKLVFGEYFTDREKEFSRLKQNFLFGQNTILMSPRRWGKTSLIDKVAEALNKEQKEVKVVRLDMFNIRSEADFYKSLSEGVFGAVSKKFDDLVSNVKQFMKQFIPKISFSPDANQEFSLGMNWNDVMKNPDEVLDMAEQIAIDKGVKLVICIDEFQNIGYFKDALSFQKKARSHWQKHKNVSYCLFGSKMHMLLEVFTSASMPFYNFGDIIFLDKIDNECWIKFIQGRFKKTGKKISKKRAGLIAGMVNNHPYYVQQLAQQTWLRTRETVEDEIIKIAMESLVLQLSLLFQTVTDSISSGQINFLHAILKGENKLSSKEVIDKYKLGSSANISRVKDALLSKEILNVRGTTIEMLDPVYEYWLLHYYFKIN